MNQINKTLLAIAIVMGSVLSAQWISPSLTGFAAAATGNCGCGCEADKDVCDTCECVSCDQARRCTKRKGCQCKRCHKPGKKLCCPSCAVECDTCTLELEHYEEEKICFKTEQKTICIPPVRFPWEKCCPPGRTSKTRAINVLKVHKYKCKVCGYKWKLDPLPEPCSPGAAAPTEAAATSEPATTPETGGESTAAVESGNNIDPVVAPVENGVLLPSTEAPQPGFEPAVETPAAPLSSVPPAPAN